MREFAVRYVNGPLQGQGTITQPDQAEEPPLTQRVPLPSHEPGLRRTLADTYGASGFAIYERGRYDDATNEWEFSLVRVE